MSSSQSSLQLDLDSFTGSENIYKHWLGLQYTDGIKYLVTQANSFWLLDAIASHQTKKLLATPGLKDFQLWELNVSENHSALLTCKADTDTNPLVRQEIEYTDFPLNFIKLYLVQKVLLLPTEY